MHNAKFTSFFHFQRGRRLVGNLITGVLRGAFVGGATYLDLGGCPWGGYSRFSGVLPHTFCYELNLFASRSIMVVVYTSFGGV